MDYKVVKSYYNNKGNIAERKVVRTMSDKERAEKLAERINHIYKLKTKNFKKVGVYPTKIMVCEVREMYTDEQK